MNYILGKPNQVVADHTNMSHTDLKNGWKKFHYEFRNLLTGNKFQSYLFAADRKVAQSYVSSLRRPDCKAKMITEEQYNQVRG